jgi:hypothetical protein
MQTGESLVWEWAPRSSKLNWKLAESLNIEEIVARGDITAVEFYAQHFVSANITRDDAAHFGSKAVLNLFQLMQLGMDYLIKQAHN